MALYVLLDHPPFPQSGRHSLPREEKEMDREPFHQVRRAGEHQPEASVGGVVAALGGGGAQVHAAATQGLPRHAGHAGRCVCLLGSGALPVVRALGNGRLCHFFSQSLYQHLHYSLLYMICYTFIMMTLYLYNTHGQHF